MPMGKWGAIKVPYNIIRRVDKLKRAENVPRHVIIEKALVLYESLREETGDSSRVAGKKHTRGLWYAWKVLLSYAEFRTAVRYKEHLPPEEVEKLITSFEFCLWQAKTRIGIITQDEIEEALKLAREYMKTRSTRILYQLNDIVRDVFFRAVGVRYG